MTDTDSPDEEFQPCANCETLVNITEHHPTVVVRYGATANDVERVTLHFCSENCLDEWTGPFLD